MPDGTNVGFTWNCRAPTQRLALHFATDIIGVDFRGGVVTACHCDAEEQHHNCQSSPFFDYKSDTIDLENFLRHVHRRVHVHVS